MWGGGSEFESPGGMSGDVGLGDMGARGISGWGPQRYGARGCQGVRGCEMWGGSGYVGLGGFGVGGAVSGCVGCNRSGYVGLGDAEGQDVWGCGL